MEVLNRVFSGIMLTLMLTSMLTSAVYIQPVKAVGAIDERIIYIRPSGLVDPATAPIKRSTDVYTFTDDIYYKTIIVQKNNIVIDGKGHTIEHSRTGSGFLLDGVNEVTIQNVNINPSDDYWDPDVEYGFRLTNSSHIRISGNNIADCFVACMLEGSSNNTIFGNNITRNFYGILLTHGVEGTGSHNNNIFGNNITNNSECGISLHESSNNTIYHNNFIDNAHQVFDDWYTSSVNVWDDGYPSGGNYWSSYIVFDLKKGPDQDKPGSDGIGDFPYIPYIFAARDRDRYPLMQPPTAKAYIYIQHPYVGDLVVKIGVGDPSKPLWQKCVWNRIGGSQNDLKLDVDLTEAIEWMPPGKNRWYLKVYDAAKYDQGQIREFTITYLGLQNFSSTDVPVPICDFTASYAYKPSLGQAHIYIQHTYRGDLIVDIGVGSISSPLWSKRVWNGTGGSADNLDLYVGLSSAVAYLPPSATYAWWVKVYDRAAKDTGKIVTFTITYHGKTYTSPNVPVPIYNFKTSYAYIKG